MYINIIQHLNLHNQQVLNLLKLNNQLIINKTYITINKENVL